MRHFCCIAYLLLVVVGMSGLYYIDGLRIELLTARIEALEAHIEGMEK